MTVDAHNTASPLPEPPPAPSEVRTFLIADVRGYTRFTQEHGDEAAAQLAARFAARARAGVAQWGGQVVELRGDEALAVFSSARHALQAALDLQARLAEEAAATLTLPLRVGIGLDAGEAVPVEGGYRGGALNLAARLCSHAGPGEVLASETVVHLAGTVAGLAYQERDSVRLKGLAKPVRVIQVVPEANSPRSAGHAAQASARPSRVPRLGRRGVFGLALPAGLVLIVAIALIQNRPSAPPVTKHRLLYDRLDNPHTSKLRPYSRPGSFVTGFQGGEFFIRQFSQDSSDAVYQDFSGFGAQTDSAISVDTHLAGGTAHRFVMLNCRAGTNLSSGYWFELYPAERKVELWRYDTFNAPPILLKAERSAAIRAGTARNHLELTCNGATIAARVNGTEVVSAHDGTYSSGMMALGVGRSAGSHLAAEARFANLELDKLLSGH